MPQNNTSLLVTLFITATLTAFGQAPAPRPTPPPEPAVKPVIVTHTRADLDRNRIDDRIDDFVTSAQAVLKTHGETSQQGRAAQAALNASTPLEFTFDKQITQQQINDFLAAGGQFSRIFTHVSYGWTGTLPPSTVSDVATSMGESLVAITMPDEASLDLDEATQKGRVRPWSHGVRGTSTGPNRVTIAIIDSGVDGTHLDLNGRFEYWNDVSVNNHPTPVDPNGHGSHVAGIAAGSGAASGALPNQLQYTQHGTVLPAGLPLNTVHIPDSVTNVAWNSNVHWTPSGGTFLLGLVAHYNPPSPFTAEFNTASFTSPFYLSGTIANYPGKRFVGGVQLLSGLSGSAYSMHHTVTYPSPDSFPSMSGVAPETSWAGFKVFNDALVGSSLEIGNALDDLVAKRATHNIKVANMSLGFRDENNEPISNIFVRSKVNTAAANGIVVVNSAGNSGNADTHSKRGMSDPGRAHYGITVAAVNDINQVTPYSSRGFLPPGDIDAGDQDTKPDIAAPGGSIPGQSGIMAIDTNHSDGARPDGVPNDYANLQGTSMAAPFVAGAAALVIDSLQRNGETWNFTGPAALEDALRVKMILLMTATETNQPREGGASANPTLDRGAKDITEGYGMINVDAAIDATVSPVAISPNYTGSFANGLDTNRCWIKPVTLDELTEYDITLAINPSSDFDIYLYAETPDAYGNPQILASSTNASGPTEHFTYSSMTTQKAWLAIKRVSGAGNWLVDVETTPISGIKDALLY